MFKFCQVVTCLFFILLFCDPENYKEMPSLSEILNKENGSRLNLRSHVSLTTVECVNVALVANFLRLYLKHLSNHARADDHDGWVRLSTLDALL